MSITYEIDPDEKLAYLTFPEKTNVTETLAVMRQLGADSRLGKGFGVLVDVRASQFIPTFEEALMIAELVTRPAVFLSHPTAVVVSRPVQYGISNMVSTLASFRGATLRAFYEVEEARGWLRSLRKKE